jgi:4-amino-4-deoxy-L-arabinose transferase-like glycosyltransferase
VSARRRRLPRLGLAVWLLLALALATRLGYVAITPDYELVHDARNYDYHARSIATGEGYGYSFRQPTAFRPPGFSFFLAGVYDVAGVQRAEPSERLPIARIVQAFVGTLAVALIGVLAAQLWDRRAALAALALGAVYLPLILIGGAVMSEPLFVVLMLGALVAAIQHRRSSRRYAWALVAGLIAGLAMLTRANGMVLLLPLAFAVWAARPRWSWRALAPPALLVAVALLTVTPWTIRNQEQLGSFVPVSTQLGSALAGTYNDEARNDRENPASWRSLKRVDDYRYLYSRVGTIPEPALERKLRAAALRYIGDHPLYVGEVAFWTTRRMLDLGGLDWARHTYSTVSVGPGWADAGVVSFWVFALLAIAGAWTARARRVPWWVWAVPLLMYLSVVFLVVETPRYRSPIDPFVILLAAAALAAWRPRAPVRAGR